MNARRDENQKTVIIGYDAISGEPVECAVDPITGRLLVEIIPVSADTPPISENILKRDGNYNAVSGLYNETDNTIEPLYVDADNGGVRADVLIE